MTKFNTIELPEGVSYHWLVDLIEGKGKGKRREKRKRKGEKKDGTF